ERHQDDKAEYVREVRVDGADEVAVLGRDAAERRIGPLQLRFDPRDRVLRRARRAVGGRERLDQAVAALAPGRGRSGAGYAGSGLQLRQVRSRARAVLDDDDERL